MPPDMTGGIGNFVRGKDKGLIKYISKNKMNNRSDLGLSHIS